MVPYDEWQGSDKEQGADGTWSIFPHKDLKEGFMGNSVEKEAQGSGDPKTWQWDFIRITLKL